MCYGKIRQGKIRQYGTIQPIVGVCLVGLSLMLLGCTNAPVNSNPVNPSPSIDPLFTANRPPQLGQPQQIPFTLSAKIKDKTFKLAVAQTPEEQQMGLMFRTSLPDDEGMLFPFEPPRPVGFWMKNTLIALDMLYIRNEVIQEIKANVPPCKKDPCPSYPSKVEIDQVIEIRGGLAQELGIKPGDQVTLTAIDPPAKVPQK
jgi:uncharacterized protein